MKSLKSLFSISLIAILLALASCSTSNDPTPVKPLTALDSVKNAMTGTWNFESLTLTQTVNGKVKTITSCDKSSMLNFYTDTNWNHYTLIFNWIYSGGSVVNGSNVCVTASDNYNITTNQNTDGTVNITFDAGGGAKLVFVVESKNVSSTEVKVTLLSNGNFIASTEGYVPVIVFKRS